MSLITENNRQYYEGTQSFIGDDEQNVFLTTFNTDLLFRSYDPNNEYYPLNNFKLYTSATGFPGSFNEFTSQYNVINNAIVFNGPINAGTYIVVQLKRLEGGKYGNNDAYGSTVEENYGSYAYIKLDELINNFIVAYVGDDKLIPTVKRTDIIFHAKRGLQEFSYDVLKSIKSQELTIPHSLSIPIPQDYVNYVKISRIDANGIKHIIYPGKISGTPYTMPIQDSEGFPIQDTFDNNITGTSIIEERWNSNKNNQLRNNEEYFASDMYNDGNISIMLGQRYGMDTSNANINGTFMINDREGKISFSSDLVDCIILLEYISDGLAYDLDTKVPKLAEEAMYAYILHSIISNKQNQPEYLVQRLKQEKFAKIRNAKIRLSNIKLEEFTKVLRGQYKWIKH
jgi:hypothetical protein